MLMDEEGLQETPNKLIHIGKPIDMDADAFRQQLAELKTACEMDDQAIKEAVSRVVTTYKVDKKTDKNFTEEMTADKSKGKNAEKTA
jgi:hypothetical protein